MSIYFDFKTISELTSNNYNYNREEKEFTLEELQEYDGENESPAYVAIEGVVYDVSEIPAWKTGKHFGLTAGQDLSEQFNSCHGIIDILTNAPKVGILMNDDYMNDGYMNGGYMNGGLNTSMNRLIRQQDTSKFTPDDWLRYTVPLVTYALREPSQGMNVQRIYQKIILMGVLVGLGKTPQEAINQVQEWQNTGVAKLLQGGTAIGGTGTGTGTGGTAGGVTGTGGTTGGGAGTSGGFGTGGTTGTGTGTTGGFGTGGTAGGGTGTTGGFGTGGTAGGGAGTTGGFGTGGTAGGGTGSTGGFGTGGTAGGGIGTGGGFGTGGTTGGGIGTGGGFGTGGTTGGGMGTSGGFGTGGTTGGGMGTSGGFGTGGTAGGGTGTSGGAGTGGTTGNVGTGGGRRDRLYTD